MTGKVYLVGAGPGDPGLVTVRGRELVMEAEALVYDFLANPTLVALSPDTCERIYVGKKGGSHTMPQEEINAMLVSLARDGKSVVRLKGGDPFIFGRGGEEALELAKNGIAFEVVPGITSGVAAPAYAGIPLTHRGLAASALLVTGHEAAGKTESDIDWEGIARSKTTIAFYMGVKNLGSVTATLIEYGRDRNTPTALIRWGTLPRQETLTGTLGDISDQADKANFKAPAICVVGEVVDLRGALRWFDTRPLHGKRIIVTRSRSSRSSFAEALRRAGADVVEFPTIAIEPVVDHGLHAALFPDDQYDWLVFTSQNAVHRYFAELSKAGKDSRSLAGTRIGCVGAATANELLTHGIQADVIPERQTSEGLLEKLDGMHADFSEAKVCFPCSEIARDTIPEGLSRRGAEVRRIPVYRTVRPKFAPGEIESAFDPIPDLVAFTSSSTVDNLVSVLKDAGREDLQETIVGAAIGPTTAATASGYGIPLGCESSEANIEGLIKSIISYLQEKS